MPCQFPGMDPYLEAGNWRDFHVELIVEIRHALVPALQPKYVVLAEERIFLEHTRPDSPLYIVPDLVVAEPRQPYSTRPAGHGTAVLEPFEITLPIPEEITERFLTIRDRESREVVTIIEVLSPTNKRAGSDGLRQYLLKREEVLLSTTSLVEIDLLRGGETLPVVDELPPCDYQAIVSWGLPRRHSKAWRWTVRHSLPTIPIPLANGDPDAQLALQEVFDTIYDRAGYGYSVEYSVPMDPPFCSDDQTWVSEILGKPDSVTV